MTAASIPASARWRCDLCHTIFQGDDTSACPQCGNADGETITVMPAATVVKSQPLKNGKPATAANQKSRPSVVAWDRLPGWLIGSLLLSLWWAIGGKYTIEGLPLLGNLFFGWFHIGARIAPIADGRWYLWLCWLPILISFVERQYRPWTSRAILVRERFWLVLLWLAVVALDAGATYLAVRNPAPDAWTLTQQVAASWALAATWSLMTTFGPESGLSWLWRWLRGA